MFHVVQEKIERYMDFLAFLLCPCKSEMFFGHKYYTELDRWDFRKQRQINQGLEYKLLDRKARITHHEGPLIQLMSDGATHINETEIDNWANNNKHGLLHGFFTGFIAFMHKYKCEIPRSSYAQAYDRKIIHEDIQLITSCLLHDFIAESNPRDHDQSLRKYFNSLAEATYTHSKPGDENHPLVVGDRLELRRFPDYDSWVNLDVLKKYFDNDPIIEHFYRFTRPALEHCYINRDKVWVRHGIDVDPNSLPNKIDRQTCYPMGYWFKNGYAGSENFWSVEVGTLPFEECMWHTAEYAPWGIITLDTLQQHRGYTKRVQSRDHFGACGNVPVSNWVFVMPATKYNELHEVHHRVINVSKGFVSVEILYKMIKILKHISTLLKVSTRFRSMLEVPYI